MLPTLGGATLAGAVYAGGPSGPASGFAILLAGVSIGSRYEVTDCVIHERVDERATADLTLLARTSPTVLAPGTRLDARDDDGRTLFTGTVERTAETLLPTSGRAVEIRATAVDASQIADRRLITERVDFAIDDAHPSGWPAGEVVRSLVNSYLIGEGVTARSVEVGSYVQAAFEYESVAAAVTKLAQAIGWTWRIDANRDVNFGPRPQQAAPWAIVQDYGVEVRSTPGLVGYWRLGEAAGVATAVDLGPYGLHGTYVGSPTLGATGLVVNDPDPAVDFPGATQYVTLPVSGSAGATRINSALNSDAWTIGLVTRVHSHGGVLWGPRAGSHARLFGPTSGWASAGEIAFAQELVTVLPGVVPYTAETRLHLMYTYAAPLLSAYKDGALVYTTSYAFTNSYTGAYTINGSGTDGGAAAVEDEVALFDRALTAAEIAAHAAAGRDVWTHRPLLESVQITRTRERMRTVQILRTVTDVESRATDPCEELGLWTVVNSSPTGRPIEVHDYQSGIINFDVRAGDYLYRDLGLTAPGSLGFRFAVTNVRVAASGAALGPAGVLLCANGVGYGYALWALKSNPLAQGFIGLTTANCWTSINTPADIRSFNVAGFGSAGRPYLTVVTSRAISLYADELGSLSYAILVGSMATTIGLPGGMVGAVCTQNSDNGPEFVLDTITYPVSDRAQVTLTASDATATASLQAIEGGTGRYEAIVDLGETRQTSAHLDALTTGLVRRFGQAAAIFAYETETAGLRAGQVQPVYLTPCALADSAMLIEALEIRRVGFPRTHYAATLVSDEQQGVSGTDFWKQVLDP